MTVTLSQDTYDAMLDDLKKLRERNAALEKKAKAYDKIKKVADIEKSKGKLVYDNVKLIARLSLILKEMEGNHEGQ